MDYCILFKIKDFIMDIKDFVIDSHAHCGILDRTFDQSFEAYFSYVEKTQIKQVVTFPPVMGIYNRYDFQFKDTGQWHRHSNEPLYNYDSTECRNAIAEIKKRNMPVVLEEELKNTILFIEKLAPGVRVIIPHLGGLNGGYTAIKNYGLWDNPDVYTDTALASSFEISDYIETYGHERIMFGSDFPFGDPESELNKIYKLNINNSMRKAVLCDNITNLLADSNV